MTSKEVVASNICLQESSLGGFCKGCAVSRGAWCWYAREETVALSYVREPGDV
jgi:hypothetical protein